MSAIYIPTFPGRFPFRCLHEKTQLLLIRMGFFRRRPLGSWYALFRRLPAVLMFVSADVICFRIGGEQAALQRDARCDWSRETTAAFNHSWVPKPVLSRPFIVVEICFWPHSSQVFFLWVYNKRNVNFYLGLCFNNSVF